MAVKTYSLMVLASTLFFASAVASETKTGIVSETRKSDRGAQFANDCPVAQVSWVFPESEANSLRKPVSAGFEFSEADVPEIQIGPELLHRDSVEPTARASRPSVNREVLSELQELLRKPTAQKSTDEESGVGRETAPTTAGTHYLEELRHLGRNDNSWILLNGKFAIENAESVKQAQPNYLTELRQLNDRIRRLHPLVVHPPTTPHFAVSLIRPDSFQQEASLERLFAPMKQVQIQTFDTKDAQEPAWKQRLDDGSGTKTSSDDFLHGAVPGYYLTPARFGVARPNRALYRFRCNPLYFEDPNLERCGAGSGCLTNLVSFGHFTFNSAILPYRLAAEPPGCCVTTLGDCPTCNEYEAGVSLPPWSLYGLAAEAAAVTGLVFIIP